MFLEIAGLVSDSGVIIGRFREPESLPSTTLASRDALCNTPPPLERVSRRPAGIPGESRHFGLGLGFDGMVKHRFLSIHHERFPGRSREGLPDSISGLI